MNQKGTIYRSQSIFVFDDPQRRCYNGAFGAHHYESGPWERFESGVTEDRVQFWRSLNDYAVSARGKSARVEYQWRPE